MFSRQNVTAALSSAVSPSHLNKNSSADHLLAYGLQGLRDRIYPISLFSVKKGFCLFKNVGEVSESISSTPLVVQIVYTWRFKLLNVRQAGKKLIGRNKQQAGNAFVKNPS